MKKNKIFFLFLTFFVWLNSCIENGSITIEENDTGRNLIIPLYKEDKTLWDKVITLNIDGLITVVNPDNGVGYTKSLFYEEIINKLVIANKKVIGYISTSYSYRNLEDVKEEIDKWLTFYPNIDGFFIDEVSGDTDDYDYYEEIYFYIKSKGDFFTVLNIGSYPDEKYFNIADNIVVYEGDVYFLKTDICNNHPSKSTIIVYNGTEKDMENIIENSNCKYIYITDDNLPNPYDTLPTYIDIEVETIKIY